MINWIIFIIIYILYLEVMKYLDEKRNKDNKDINFLNSEIKRIKLNHSTAEDNILYLKYKNEMRKKLGGGFLHLLIMIFSFLVFLFLYDYVQKNLFDSIILAIVVSFSFSKLASVVIKTIDKYNMLWKDFFSEMFIFSYIIINTQSTFTIGKWQIGFIFMLPILLIIKIIYNNLKKGVLTWSQR